MCTVTTYHPFPGRGRVFHVQRLQAVERREPQALVVRRVILRLTSKPTAMGWLRRPSLRLADR